jgi:hypothetical protein
MRKRHLWKAALAWAMLIGAADEQPNLPGWMAGCWERTNGDRWTEECWTEPRAGIMRGSGRSGRGDHLEEWESMQIILAAPSDTGEIVKMAFFAAPGGGKRTLFAWSPTKGDGVAFFNAAHDYPQRIRYWRNGEELVAEIAMADGSRAKQWHYHRK